MDYRRSPVRRRSTFVKGTIVKCMEELVTTKFGEDKWRESLKKAAIPEWRSFTTFCDVDEAEVMAIMNGIAGAASLSMEQLMEAFGEYWSTVYAPNIYVAYFPTPRARASYCSTSTTFTKS
jgi:hypothetical protein